MSGSFILIIIQLASANIIAAVLFYVFSHCVCCEARLHRAHTFFHDLFSNVGDRWRCRPICARDTCKLTLNFSFHILFRCSQPRRARAKWFFKYCFWLTFRIADHYGCFMCNTRRVVHFVWYWHFYITITFILFY